MLHAKSYITQQLRTKHTEC